MSEIEREMRDRMLHLEEDNQQDSEEYKQLEAVLNNEGSARDVHKVIDQYEKPEEKEARYPTDEHLVTCYCSSMDFVNLGQTLIEKSVEILESKNCTSGCSYFVRGIPNELAYLQGVELIGWRTQKMYDDLLKSFEKKTTDS